ncbi:hypothetical protein RhiirA5_155989 [Rhizophagus irregularis]|uniref:Uncharacterized protein n=1 Tax=Rhizophagus irregularis TaxID=588596 RepID=A0A2N0PRY2_9GLOM|nr:hypothetical protein RhiirA5_155989 [Rhizophagus irregularis]GET56841.1 hypothetical protein RIR_jg28240.t1 [Rhizophagus irregularis DAOM 181602=DAOM 197198]
MYHASVKNAMHYIILHISAKKKYNYIFYLLDLNFYTNQSLCIYLSQPIEPVLRFFYSNSIIITESCIIILCDKNQPFSLYNIYFFNITISNLKLSSSAILTRYLKTILCPIHTDNIVL